MEKSKNYMLIGVPGAGKSTWIKSQNWIEQCAYISTDALIDEEAIRQGKTYNEVFHDYIKTATTLMNQNVVEAQQLKKDVIWDQTNTTKKSRANKLKTLSEYEHIAIVFKTPDRSELDVRLSGRPGKHIPKNVVDSMIENFEMPTLEEGFTQIWFAS
jgi:predicted kinase